MDYSAYIPFDKQEYLKKQRPIDDIMFRLCAGHKSFCEELLRTVLDDADLTVEENIVQYNLTNPGRRSVVLDAKCRLGDGSLVNIEVQTGDRDNHQKRVRLHAALMTAEAGKPQMEFAEIPNVCTIYICEFDIFGYNQSIYRVDRVLRGLGKVLDNGYTEIYINALARDGSKASRLMELFVNREAYNYDEFGEVSRVKDFFINTKEGQEKMYMIYDDLWLDLYEKIRDECIAEIKKECIAEVRKECFAEVKKECIAEGKKEGIAEGKKEGLAEGKKEGLAEGKKEGIISTFIGLVREGIFTVAEASKRADVSEETFKAFMDKYNKEQTQIQTS